MTEILNTNLRLASSAEIDAFLGTALPAFSATDQILAMLLGLPAGSWSSATVDTPRGRVIVSICDDAAKVAVLDAGGNVVIRETYALGPETIYFVQKSSPGFSLRRVPPAFLDDTTPTAVVQVRRGNHWSRAAGLDQFYCKDGYFRIECSHELPAEVLARALLSAWSAVDSDVAKVMEPDAGDRARA